MGFYTERQYSLDDSKNHCLIEIESWYGGKVLDVFDSSATGVNRRYYCAESDQLRMVNGKIANVSMTLMCGVVPADPNQDPVWDWLNHSSTECGKVHTDYVQFSKAASEQRLGMIASVNSATTLAELDAIFATMYG